MPEQAEPAQAVGLFWQAGFKRFQNFGTWQAAGFHLLDPILTHFFHCKIHCLYGFIRQGDRVDICA